MGSKNTFRKSLGHPFFRRRADLARCRETWKISRGRHSAFEEVKIRIFGSSSLNRESGEGTGRHGHRAKKDQHNG